MTYIEKLTNDIELFLKVTKDIETENNGEDEPFTYKQAKEVLDYFLDQATNFEENRG